jgi:hypothetical protein
MASVDHALATPYCVAAFCFARLPLFEIALVLVRFDHVASFIVNAVLVPIAS